MFVAYSAWSFRDGLSAYPKDNRDKLLQNVKDAPDTPPDINPEVTKERAEALAARVRAEGSIPLDDVTALFGSEATVREAYHYYFGKGGLAIAAVSGSRVANVDWKAGPHTESDLALQLGIGALTGLLGLIMVLQLGRAALTRIELTDQGLKLNSQGGWQFGGSPLIPFEDMIALRDPDNRFREKKSDYVELVYRKPDGTEDSVRLNMYVHKAFPQIIAEICRRKGFDNPLDRSETEDEPDTSNGGIGADAGDGGNGAD
jgi:hypothetical protein